MAIAGEASLELAVQLNNRVLEGFEGRGDTRFGLHVCRGNWSQDESTLLRGSYHLYQGLGGFVGNLVMGLVFGRVWQRQGRLWIQAASSAARRYR